MIDGAPPPDGPPAPRRTSSGSQKAVTAARPTPASAEPSGPISTRLKSGAADTALNVAGVLRDTWEDFRSSDQFFKYKAGILATWLLLSAATFAVSCPGGPQPSNTIGARFVPTQVTDTLAIMIVNEGDEPWREVTVVVNGRYRAAVPTVSNETGENFIVLEPRNLMGSSGPAPRDLKLKELEVRTSEGRARLMEGGRPVK